jgi:hypothetical protein
MRWPDPADGPAGIANRVLADQSWARDKLASVAGRVFYARRRTGFPRAGASRADDSFAAASRDASVDLRLSLSPFSVPSFLADPSRWNELVREEGDARAAAAC